jgi:hypothetical protein
MAANLESEVKLQLGYTFPNYGRLFMRFKLKLDSREEFTMEGLELVKGFEERFRFTFIWTRGDEKDMR